MAVELHGEVVPHYHVLAESRGALDEAVEPGMELGRASGDVQRADARVALEDLEALRDALGRHHLAARGRSVDMAVAALLVAQLGDVHLQRVDREWRQLHASTMQYRLEVMAGARGRRPNGNRQAQSTSLFRCLSICTECTSVI